MSLKDKLDVSKLDDNQKEEGQNLFNSLMSYEDNFNIEALENILKLNENDKNTFVYFEEMSNENFELFKRNLFLSYPPYIIKYLFNKFSQVDYMSNERLKEITNCLKYIVNQSLLNDPINLNTIVSKKDQDYPLLLFLEKN